uniref:Uncharacterized protein n=1 Tax=Rhodopseudomonas palustris (strain BisA53) TaxID=316055 RepID=Q07NW2_RHOP5
MRSAIDKASGQEVSAEEFHKRIGSRTAQVEDRFQQPDAICRVCHESVYLVDGSPERASHFRHRIKSFCPTIFPTGEPYMKMTPNRGDAASGQVLRAAVRRHWHAHYSVLRGIVPFLSPEEFVSLLQFASERRTWDYRGLCESQIPYVMILLADFPPWTSTRKGGQNERHLWFRFWYSRHAQSIEDLWTRPRGQPMLYRGSFTPPDRQNGRPLFDNLLADKPVDLDYDFLTRETRVPPQFVSNHVERWFLHSRYF